MIIRDVSENESDSPDLKCADFTLRGKQIKSVISELRSSVVLITDPNLLRRLCAYQYASWGLVLHSATELSYFLCDGCEFALVVVCVLEQLMELPLHCFLLCLQYVKGLLLILLDQTEQGAVLMLEQLLCPVAHLLNTIGHIRE